MVAIVKSEYSTFLPGSKRKFGEDHKHVFDVEDDVLLPDEDGEYGDEEEKGRMSVKMGNIASIMPSDNI